LLAGLADQLIYRRYYYTVFSWCCCYFDLQ